MGTRSQSLLKIAGMTLGAAILVGLCTAAVLVDKKRRSSEKTRTRRNPRARGRVGWPTGIGTPLSSMPTS